MTIATAAPTRYRQVKVARGCTLVHADCIDWLNDQPEHSIHAVVTDPPYGLKEYRRAEIEVRNDRTRGGGIWRIPPSFDGADRAPLPRFTALNEKERKELVAFFTAWSKALARVLRPGAHVLVAANSFLSQPVFGAIAASGLEFRGEVIRLVRTLRGGDRPKGAEHEFPDVTSLARGCFEPWGVFRKAMPRGMTVGECLRTHQTGALRRLPDGGPFCDVITSERTPRAERAVADHPSLKPQSLLRQLTRAVVPTGGGIVLDPFAGSGSTIAAAAALGISAVGIERHNEYFDLACSAVPKLAAVRTKHDEVASHVLFNWTD